MFAELDNYLVPVWEIRYIEDKSTEDNNLIAVYLKSGQTLEVHNDSFYTVQTRVNEASKVPGTTVFNTTPAPFSPLHY